MTKDTFRKHYHTLKEINAALIIEIKCKAEELEELYANVKSREMSLAMTNLEQSTMWATKAIVLDDEKQQEIVE
jgi:hypothetical protein